MGIKLTSTRRAMLAMMATVEVSDMVDQHERDRERAAPSRLNRKARRLARARRWCEACGNKRRACACA